MKKFFIFVFSLLILPISVSANTVINGNDFEVYNRSKEDIYNQWNTGKIDSSVNVFVSNPSYNAPYVAGVVTNDYLNEVVENLNYYRYLVGVPSVGSTSNDVELQTAEVVQTLYVVQNSALTHNLIDDFTKPSDMDQSFYDLGANANHNIISYGRTDEPNFYFFDESKFDPSFPEAGHRMALLSPEVSKEDYGIGYFTVYGRSNADRTNYNRMTNSFAAYPSPGYFPKEDFASNSDWDIFLNIDDFAFLTSEERNNVSVTIKDLDTNESYERSLSAGNLFFDYTCYGTMCTIYDRINILQPPKTENYYDGSYKVTVKNLKNKSGNLVDLEYTVNFYDKFEATTSNVVDAKFAISRVYLDGEFNEDLVDSALEDIYITLTLDNGNTYNYVPNSYNIEHAGISYGSELYFAYPLLDNLPSYINDPDNMLGELSLRVYNNVNADYYRMEYVDTLYNKVVGDNVTLQIDDVYIDEDGYISYGWVREKDGEYIDLDSSRGYTLDNFNLVINNLTKDDEGKYYFLLVLATEDNDIYYYISKPITLNISIPVDSISFESESVNIHIGETIKLVPIINPEGADCTLTWGTTTVSSVYFDNEGNVTGNSIGSTQIVVTDGKHNAYIWVNVIPLAGDLNKNNKIDLPDVVSLLKIYLGVQDADETDLLIGDMNEDKEIGLQDIIMLLRVYLGVD